jgi:hypothetical protein
MISVKHEIQRIGRNAQRIERQLPFAIALALTRTVQGVQKAEIHEMRDVFDRPTRYTLNSTYIEPATKQQLRATVGLKDEASEGTPPTKYLRPQLVGGGRRLKRFEKALRSVGVLPNGYVAVPGSAAKIDRFGNMSRGELNQILSYFRTNATSGFNFNASQASLRRRSNRLARQASAQSVQYFVGRPGDGKLPLGVWQRYTFRSGSAIKPILIFIPWASYEGIFDFRYVGEITIRKLFPREFSSALARVLRGKVA